ncbi:MAG: CZB domain-containing protein [Candidatus Korobacteraceae bacterium]
MNFDEAITCHTKWKMKLASYLAKPDHSLTAAVVESPSQCDLGKWINGEGKKHSSLPEFAAMVSGHTAFHKAAAEVVRKADSGQKVGEEIALGAKSEFAAASSAVVRSLMALKSKI